MSVVVAAAGVYILSPMSAIIAEMPATAAVFAVVTAVYYR
jgi:hypothetical protein